MNRIRILVVLGVVIVVGSLLAGFLIAGDKGCGEKTMTLEEATWALHEDVSYMGGWWGTGHSEERGTIEIMVADDETAERIPECYEGWPVVTMIIGPEGPGWRIS